MYFAGDPSLALRYANLLILSNHQIVLLDLERLYTVRNKYPTGMQKCQGKHQRLSGFNYMKNVYCWRR
jgi:hypothetical protein